MDVDKLYQQHKNDGLEVMWILGEDAAGELITEHWIQEMLDDKGVDIPVLRDHKFLQVYGHIDPHSSALPHQYILDAQTMELVHASGGINQESEDKILELLGK